MALQQRNPSAHNKMLGGRQTTLTALFQKPNAHATQSISTSHSSHDTFEQRPAKRRRTSPSLDEAKEYHTRNPRKSIPQLCPQSQSTRSDRIAPRSPAKPARYVADSDAESGDDEIDPEEPTSTQRTDIEQALPPIKTDKEAIEEYETLRAQESASHAQERFGTRAWVPGKSSIYVDAFNLALETVLEEESHLFDEAETKVFDDWKALSYEAQYLYVNEAGTIIQEKG